jgi:hypothetical protein
MNSDSSLQMYDYNQSIWQALADWRIMSLRPAWDTQGDLSQKIKKNELQM